MMGKKTGEKTQVLLRLNKEPELLRKFRAIQRTIGIEGNANLVRMLINQKYEELREERKIT
jgi:hypothetical protein